VIDHDPEPVLLEDEPVLTEARPLAQLSRLLVAFRAYLALEDVGHVLFALAVSVGARLEGDRLWGLLVAPPSSGKTETLRALDEVADEHLDEISAAGLLGWLPGKGGGKMIGLLARRRGDVFATVADLSTLLAMSDRGGRDQLYALMRRAYDGRVVRELGNAPEPLRWEGSLTLLAAVTPAVDRYASHSDALGPRWLFMRIPTTDDRMRRESARKARESGLSLTQHRQTVREIATELVADAVKRARSVTVSDELGVVIDDAAIVTCLGRADVPRDGYGRREIIGMPTIEEPPRLAAQLDKLARGLLALGLDNESAAALCRRAALDSMPLERRACIETLADGRALTQVQVARQARCDRNVARRTLEDLAAIGIATYDGAESDDEDARRGPWHLIGENVETIERVFGAPRDVPKSVTYPHLPPQEGEEVEGGVTHFGTSENGSEPK